MNFKENELFKELLQLITKGGEIKVTDEGEIKAEDYLIIRNIDKFNDIVKKLGYELKFKE